MILTGQGIRNDKGGSGYFGAPRSKTVNGVKVSYKHEGTDFVCMPGQVIKMPVTGKVARLAYPYPDKSYGGVVIESKRATLKIFYVKPYDGVVGMVLKLGDPIGTAQDVSLRYPGQGVTPHIHVQVETCDPEIFLKNVEEAHS